MKSGRFVVFVVLVALACACSDPEVDSDTGVRPDASGPKDAAEIDAASTDAETETDAGARDAAPDAGSQDAAPIEDAGTPMTNLVFVGSGDFGSTDGRITSYRFDPVASQLMRTSSIAAGDIASFLAFDQARGVVHVADEGGGRVISFEILDDDGRLRLLDQRDSRGNPVHVSLTASGEHLVVAHYNQGRIEVFGLQANGAVDDATDLVESGAESHSTLISPDDAFLLVMAKGEDWIAQFRFDDTDGTVADNTPLYVDTADGAGPRHIALHPDGAHAYVINELDNTVDAYAFDASTGTLTHLQTISGLPANFPNASSGADIHVHPNGLFLYASERVIGGPGLIAIFSIDPNGMLTAIGHEETRGDTPRNFTLTPNGSHLIAANQSTSTLAIFTIDGATGMLQFVRTEDVGARPFFVGVVVR